MSADSNHVAAGGSLGAPVQGRDKDNNNTVNGRLFYNSPPPQHNHSNTATSSRHSSTPADDHTPSTTNGSTAPPRYLRACDNCRRRKVKCDGTKPSCAHCQRVGASCHYSIKPKSRRTWKCLETPVVPTDPGSGLGGHDRTQDDLTSRLLARVETMERLLLQRNGVSSPRLAGPSSGSVGMGLAVSAASNIDEQRQGKQGFTIGGPPSGKRMSESDGISLFGTSGELGENTAGAGAERYLCPALPSIEIMSELIDTFFAVNDILVMMVNEKAFRKQFAAGTMSPLLLYATLASAARYSNSPAVRTDPPHMASIPFMNKAKTLIADAIDEPSLGNAQGLMVMCLMSFAMGQENSSTSYKALTFNMCILLGYNQLDSVEGPVRHTHECGEPMVPQAALPMDAMEREAARRVWWTVFSIENYASVCMGMAPSVQAESCNLHLPGSDYEWRHGSPEPCADGSPKAKRLRESESPINKLTAYHAQLTIIFSKIACLVTRSGSDTEDALAEFSELNSVLQRWYESLPKELRLSSVSSAIFGQTNPFEYYQVCVLHMRFYATVIQLNHAIPEFTDDPATIEPGQRKCVIAASRISDMLRSSFDIPVNARDMNWYMCVFRAAHIHIYRLLSRDPESISRAKQDLAVHRKHLREGGALWRICYKLLSRLDDMEQMVMLLPAQIPVQDLVKLKRLTKKGRSQLVNMQLDSLIKPDLFQAAMQENDDVPLLARKEIIAQTQHPASASMLSGVLQPQFPSSGSMLAGSVGSVTTTVGSPGSAGGSLPPPQQRQQRQQQTFSPNAAGGGPQDSAEMQRRINVLHDGLNSTQPASMPASQPPIVPPAPIALHPANVQPINTNLVIDNNMAETLVNYFYMVASSQNQRSSSSTERTGSVSSTSGPALPTIGAAMVSQQGGTLPDLASLTSPQSFLSLKDQQPQVGSVQQSPQQLFSNVYDPATMQKFPDDNGSFV